MAGGSKLPESVFRGATLGGASNLFSVRAASADEGCPHVGVQRAENSCVVALQRCCAPAIVLVVRSARLRRVDANASRAF
jgi:hypothetical protein